MEETKCKVCGRVFYGSTVSQVESNLAGHMNVHAKAQSVRAE